MRTLEQLKTVRVADMTQEERDACIFAACKKLEAHFAACQKQLTTIFNHVS